MFFLQVLTLAVLDVTLPMGQDLVMPGMLNRHMIAILIAMLGVVVPN